MAIEKGFRFPVSFEQAFRQGLVMVGEVAPDTEYQQNRNAPAKQRIDETTGLPVWKVTVTDPDQPNAKRASFDLYLLSKHQPVPTTERFSPMVDMRPIVGLTDLTAEPKIAGNGEFKYQSYVFRATGFAEPSSVGQRPAGRGKAGAGEQADKAA